MKKKKKLCSVNCCALEKFKNRTTVKHDDITCFLRFYSVDVLTNSNSNSRYSNYNILLNVKKKKEIFKLSLRHRQMYNTHRTVRCNYLESIRITY